MKAGQPKEAEELPLQVEAPSLAAGTWPYLLSKKAITIEDPDSFKSRWRMPVAGALVHVSIGSVYAWSIWNAPLTQQLGVVAQAAGDWSLGDVLSVFSFTAVSLGVTTFVLGPWQERAGPRMVGFAVAQAYAAAFVLTGLGAQHHSLALMYAGYGLLGGIGWGLGYLSPVSTLMRWFPERRGLAAGLALTCFGMGAAVGAPLINALVERNFVPPVYLGRVADVPLLVEGGVCYADHGGHSVEVVVATAADLARLPFPLAEGVYVVGSGDTGAAAAMFTLGGAYYCAILLGAWLVRVPREGWWPAGVTRGEEDFALAAAPSVDYDAALRTAQFPLFLALVMGNAFAGMILISSAKTLMTDIFAAAMPAIVTSSFAASYVSSLGLANSAGRAGWAIASDLVGPRRTFSLFALGIPIVGSIPSIAHAASSGVLGALPLYFFYGGTLASISFYGGSFSCLPPYLAATFGPRHMGAIHGRVLSAWAVAAFSGPKVLGLLRDQANSSAIDDLVALCPAEKFEASFGAPVSELATLKASNAVTIARLLELTPPGTLDPTPTLYNNACYVVCGLLTMSAAANAFIRPVPR